MKKTVILLTTALLFALSVSAQLAIVQETAVDWNKQQVRGFQMTFVDKNADLVTNGVQERLTKVEGLKSSKSRGGYTAYLNQVVPSIGSTVVNLYTKVESISRKSAGCVLTVVVCSDNGTPITATSHPDLYNAVQDYLNTFATYLHNYEIQQKILENTNMLTKQQKELASLQSDKEKIEKKLSSLKDDIAAYESKINKTKADVSSAENNLRNKNNEFLKKQDEVHTTEQTLNDLKNQIK